MLTLKQRKYIKNKITLTIKIKKTLKYLMLNSFIQNKKLTNTTRIIYLIKLMYYKPTKTKKTHVCLTTGKNRNMTKYSNFNRHEFHNLCRTNKLNNWNIYSW